MTSLANANAQLSATLSSLVQLCQRKFQIVLSEPQLHEPQYRAAVMAELAGLDDAELLQLLQQVKIQAQAVADAEVKPATDVVPGTGKRSLIVASICGLALLGAGALSYFWLAGAQPATASTISATASAVPANSNTVNNDMANSTTADSSTANHNSTTARTAAAQQAAAVAPAEVMLRLHGSNTVGEKLAPVLIEGFLAAHGADSFSWQQQGAEVERALRYQLADKLQQVELHAHGSSTAFKDLLRNKADIGMSSRRITPDEVTKARAELGDLSKIGNEHIIALDGLAIIVNQNNPLKAISTETLAKIFSGEISRWSQLGGAERPITLLARDDNSGTFDTFNSLVLKKHNKQLSDKARRLESSTELSVEVSQDEGAIGFIGLNYISYNKALAISEGADTTPIYPTRFTISTEDYALSRRLYLYTPTGASQLAKDFAQFAISEQGQALVEQSGLISQNIREERVLEVADAPPSYNRYAATGQRLSLNFRFNYGENDLDNKGKRDLERLMRYMEQHSSRRLVLMGFSDSVGAVAKNTELALRRAKAVERELVSRGLPVLAVESYGELLPVANNDTDAGRERNRRVEVWVL